MTVLYALSVLLFAAAIALLLGLTPERIEGDFTRLLTPEKSLRDMARIAQGKKKGRKLSSEFAAIRDAMQTVGKEKQFTAVCTMSLFLMVGGVVFSLIIGNVFLMPVLAVILAVVPFLHVKSSLAYYKKHVEAEIETALSIISTSYLRCDSIVSAVTENLGYLKPPVNQIFREWCGCLLQCQDDRSMKTALLPIVNKLTDAQIVNNELKTMLSEPRKEYWMMVLLVVGNIPLLYIINRDWFHALINTAPGKIVLAISGVVIAVTSMFMAKYTKPIEYKR
jgi:Flp pilus assembly protein TadB